MTSKANNYWTDIFRPSARRFPAQRVRFIGVPDSPASSFAPESIYSSNSQTSQYDDFYPEDSIVFDRPGYYYSPSDQSNGRPSSRRVSSSLIEELSHVEQGRMSARRMAPASRGGRIMGFPPAVASPSSIYSENSPRFMDMRPPHASRTRLMSEDSSFGPSHMGPSSPNMTSPYAPGPSRYRERERIQRK